MTPDFQYTSAAQRVVFASGELLNEDRTVAEVKPGYVPGFFLAVEIAVLYGSGYGLVVHIDPFAIILCRPGDTHRNDRDWMVGYGRSSFSHFVRVEKRA